MMERLDNWIARLTDPALRASVLRLFPVAVFSWMVINAFMVWDVRDMLWGSDTLLMRYGATLGLIENVVYKLMYVPSIFPVIYFGHVACSLAGIWNWKWAFIPRTLAWFSGLMLYFGAIPAFNSGMLLMLLLAFYSIPVFVGASHSFRRVLNQFSWYAGALQVLLCYLFPSIYKLTGEQWLSGEAVYYSLHIERFSHPVLRNGSFLENDFLLLTLSYFAFSYQVLFPLMVLWKKHRGWFLLIGVGLHLFIAIVMNLWDFGLAMIFAYVLFLGEGSSRFLEKSFLIRSKQIPKNS